MAQCCGTSLDTQASTEAEHEQFSRDDKDPIYHHKEKEETLDSSSNRIEALPHELVSMVLQRVNRSTFVSFCFVSKQYYEELMPRERRRPPIPSKSRYCEVAARVGYLGLIKWALNQMRCHGHREGVQQGSLQRRPWDVAVTEK